jgi:hypothetical protein
MREIERALRRVASSPHTKYNREKVESHVLKIKETTGTLHALLSFSPREGPRGDKSTPHDAATASEPASGMSLRLQK